MFATGLVDYLLHFFALTWLCILVTVPHTCTVEPQLIGSYKHASLTESLSNHTFRLSENQKYSLVIE